MRMTGATAGLRAVRKPALALLAAAGLVASCGAVVPVQALVDGPVPIVPGRAVVTVLAHGESPALGSGGPVTAGLLADPGERHQPRPPGGGGAHARGTGPASLLHAESRHGHGPVLSRIARGRAMLRGTPSTGPPSFPS